MSETPSDRAPNLPPIREVLDKNDLRAKKKFGQNFLLDLNITDKIARAVRLEGQHVIEVGPGPGGLTRSLLNAGAGKVSAIEFDDRLIPVLKELQSAYGEDRLEIIKADALEVDFYDFPTGAHIVANLPYNIATPLVIKWMYDLDRHAGQFSSLTLMFQKEVAKRMSASAGSKDYGRLSIICQYMCEVRRLFDLPPDAFTPPPKVTSSIVQLVPRDEENMSDQPDLKTLETLTAKAFGQRRKMIRSTLSEYGDILEDLSIDPTLRAENLTLETYLKFARKIEET